MQETQIYPCAFLLENVPPLKDPQLIILAKWLQIRAWINKLMQVDAIVIGSHTHQFQWLWINLTPLEVIQQAYQLIIRLPTCLVDDILNS